MNDPAAVKALREALLAAPRALAVGSGSKWTGRGADAGITPVSTSGFTGIVEYHHDEYTISAGSGTPLSDLVAALAEHDQYLPFDPPYAAEGATLGGTVAAGLSGSGAQRHGRLRDFILAIQFMTGDGRLMRSGAKVVKNAAGFDLPKLFTGSLGRLGILTEITLKVFPAALANRRLKVSCRSLEDAVEQLVRLNRSPFVLDGLDLIPPATLAIKLGGQRSGMEVRIERLKSFLLRPVTILTERTADPEPAIASAFPTIKVAVRPSVLVRFHQAIESIAINSRFQAGGATAWFEWPAPIEQLDQILHDRSMTGLVLRGPAAPVLIGDFSGRAFFDRIKTSFDPTRRFPPITFNSGESPASRPA